MPVALSCLPQIALVAVGWQARLLLALLLTALAFYLTRHWHSSPRDDPSRLSSLSLLVSYTFGSGSAALINEFRGMAGTTIGRLHGVKLYWGRITRRVANLTR